MKPGWACTAALLWLLAGCRPADVPPAPHAAAERLEAGRAVYNFRCYFCHGYSGDAKTLAATYLTPPPRDFTRAAPGELDRARVLAALQEGRPGTAMKSFRTVLSREEMSAVADFIVEEFVTARRPNTRYHTAQNGWPDHERYRAAYPYARGEISLNSPWEELTPEQAAGKQLYLASCVSCHDRGRAEADGVDWEPRALSYPRNNYSHTAPRSRLDAVSSASPYLLHEVAPPVKNMTARERAGARLFKDNCAFCHGADGTGRNWIGSFLEPHPRDLTDPAIMGPMTRARLTEAIREGLPGTSMPAWKSVLAPAEIEALVAYIDKAFHPLSRN